GTTAGLYFPSRALSNCGSRRGVVDPELVRGARALRPQLGLPSTELDPTDLSGDRLRQRSKLQPPDALVRGEPAAAEVEDAVGGLGARFDAGPQRDERLRDRQSQWIRTGHDGGLGNGVVFDQHAFQLERADPVVAALEHVVGPADEVHVPVAVAPRLVAGAVVTAGRRLIGPGRVVEIPLHQPERPRRQAEPDFSLVRLAALRV